MMIHKFIFTIKKKNKKKNYEASTDLQGQWNHFTSYLLGLYMYLSEFKQGSGNDLIGDYSL